MRSFFPTDASLCYCMGYGELEVHALCKAIKATSVRAQERFSQSVPEIIGMRHKLRLSIYKLKRRFCTINRMHRRMTTPRDNHLW
ncbi:hypothetical protein KC19_VG123100 [Ceratodon purpureus]|uniref:Uncharacterized protein n=1 Tax=Ceratodon purpureus TaxID=3225 RepID=A0A8T0HPP0_CERPU|nr:hypothetical protein KC19_VG123100 [Ceratodon purpureus]